MMTDRAEDAEKDEEETAASTRFFHFLILGFSIILIGIAIVLVTSILYGAGSANFGAVIFIGPIPIVIGAGPDAGFMVLFSIIIVVLSVIIFAILFRRNRRVEG